MQKKREAYKQLTNRNQTFFSTLDDQEVRDYPGGLIDALRIELSQKKPAIIIMANKLLKKLFAVVKADICSTEIIRKYYLFYLDSCTIRGVGSLYHPTLI